MDIFWLFFMLSALQPVIKQRLLEASRKRLIALIERQRKSRVVLLVHRQETMSLLGFPVFRYIDINDSEEVLRAIHLTDPEIPLDLVLHTQADWSWLQPRSRELSPSARARLRCLFRTMPCPVGH
jgi:ClpP class serine protease